jgi:hypothetical protein
LYQKQLVSLRNKRDYARRSGQDHSELSQQCDAFVSNKQAFLEQHTKEEINRIMSEYTPRTPQNSSTTGTPGGTINTDPHPTIHMATADGAGVPRSATGGPRVRFATATTTATEGLIEQQFNNIMNHHNTPRTPNSEPPRPMDTADGGGGGRRSWWSSGRRSSASAQSRPLTEEEKQDARNYMAQLGEANRGKK